MDSYKSTLEIICQSHTRAVINSSWDKQSNAFDKFVKTAPKAPPLLVFSPFFNQGN